MQVQILVDDAQGSLREGDVLCFQTPHRKILRDIGVIRRNRISRLVVDVFPDKVNYITNKIKKEKLRGSTVILPEYSHPLTTIFK